MNKLKFKNQSHVSSIDFHEETICAVKNADNSKTRLNLIVTVLFSLVFSVIVTFSLVHFAQILFSDLLGKGVISQIVY